jgi:Protease inhibitor Inh
MNNSRIFGLISAAFVTAMMAAPAIAEGNLEGTWKFALGKKAPCDVAMAADGAVTPSADCPAAIAHWKGTSTGLQLQTASGETYAVLKSKGASYEGSTFADSRTVTLSR